MSSGAVAENYPLNRLQVFGLFVATVLFMHPSLAAPRDYISVVGSSTVYPFATVVAERFGKTTSYKTPKIESTGSGGGLKLFCQGVGVKYPDIANASRRIKPSEIELCHSNDVNDIIEVLIGYDGIVFGQTRRAAPMQVTRREIYLALAKQIPNPDGSQSFIVNPYTHWNQINPELPNTRIEVLGPPPTSGTRDAFQELVMEGGCKTFPWVETIKSISKPKYTQLCHTVREDGIYIEAGENDNLIVQKLNGNDEALGIMGFSFLDQNFDTIQGALVDGFEPTFDTIADGSYPVSRPLYFYVKKSHVRTIPGMREYLLEFTSERAAGEDGYLADKGMIPLLPDSLQQVVSRINNLTTMNE